MHEMELLKWKCTLGESKEISTLTTQYTLCFSVVVERVLSNDLKYTPPHLSKERFALIHSAKSPHY